MAASWLKNACFYEIYPQSFYDTNGDGIGDIRGIIEKLNYVKSIGCNALWVNPWYDSPFADGGYDVRDHKAVAERYGTMEDAKELFRAAHEKGIRVLIDLVPGHTSEEHPWFRESAKENPDAEYAHRCGAENRKVKYSPGNPGNIFVKNGKYRLDIWLSLRIINPDK